VGVVDLEPWPARETAAAIEDRGGRALPLVVDVADRAAYEEVVKGLTEAAGPIDVLVNNAGIGARMSISDWDEHIFDRVVAVNLKGLVHGLGIVGRSMRERGGAVVNMASMGAVMGIRGLTPYTATKGAILALTRSAAMELAPRARVNAVAPGKVVTPLRARMLGREQTAEELEAQRAFYPLQTVGQPEDVAAGVAFLASDDARFITGVTLPIDGGRTAGFHDFAP